MPQLPCPALSACGCAPFAKFSLESEPKCTLSTSKCHEPGMSGEPVLHEHGQHPLSLLATVKMKSSEIFRVSIRIRWNLQAGQRELKVLILSIAVLAARTACSSWAFLRYAHLVVLPHLSHQKNLLTFHYTGCLIGIYNGSLYSLYNWVV